MRGNELLLYTAGQPYKINKNMTSPPPDFSVRLNAHVQGLHGLQEGGHLSPAENNLVSEALDIINLMIERPDLSNGLMEELSLREYARRDEATAQQAAVIWKRVGNTLAEAVQITREIGRVSPEMQVAVEKLTQVVQEKLPEVSKSAPLANAIDHVELASQSLRKHTRAARTLFHGKPHPDHEQTAQLETLALAWKTPSDAAGFLEALTHMQEVWSKAAQGPKKESRPSPGR